MGIKVAYNGCYGGFSVSRKAADHVVDELAPQALEGRKGQYVRHAWAVHNILGHPLMQIFSWLGYPKLGLEIHDITVPFPIIKE